MYLIVSTSLPRMLLQRREDLPVEEFIPEFPVEAFDVAEIETEEKTLLHIERAPGTVLGYRLKATSDITRP